MTVFKSAMVPVCVLVGFVAGTALAVNIETVAVGNVGDAADTRYAAPGYGSVHYTYNIGKYEVTAGQYTEFLNAVAATDTYGLYMTSMANIWSCGISRSGSPGSYQYHVDAAFVNRPVNVVSWGDAARFANWLHNGQPTGMQDATTTEDGAYTLNGATTNAELLTIVRSADWKWAITSEDEWYKAAYYNPFASSYYKYPTSNDSFVYRDLNDLSGNNANYYGVTYPIDSPYYTTVVGQFKNSASPYGTFDQGGNVREWTEAVIGSHRGVRGGTFGDTYMSMLASIRESRSPADELIFTGFRVVEVPEPSMVVLLGLGVLGMLRPPRMVRGALPADMPRLHTYRASTSSRCCSVSISIEATSRTLSR